MSFIEVRRTCRKCGMTFPVHMFEHTYTRRKDGTLRDARRWVCRWCMQAWRSDYYQENKDYILKRQKQHKKNDPLRRKWIELKSYAKRSGVCGPLDISLKEFKQLIKNAQDKCEYCGCALLDGNYHIEHKTPLNRGGGNTRENLAVVCTKCNLSKKNLTEAEFLEKTTGVPF